MATVNSPVVRDDCVWYIEGIDVAHVYMRPTTNGFELSDLRVQPQHQHTGLGTLLLSAVCRWADEYDQELMLVVCPSKPGLSHAGLLRFYRKFGFKGSDNKMVRKPK